MNKGANFLFFIFCLSKRQPYIFIENILFFPNLKRNLIRKDLHFCWYYGFGKFDMVFVFRGKMGQEWAKNAIFFVGFICIKIPFLVFLNHF